MAGALRALVRPSREEFLKINIRVRGGDGRRGREAKKKEKKREGKNIFDIPFAPALFSFLASPFFSLGYVYPGFPFVSSSFFHYHPKRIARNLSISLSLFLAR